MNRRRIFCLSACIIVGLVVVGLVLRSSMTSKKENIKENIEEDTLGANVSGFFFLNQEEDLTSQDLIQSVEQTQHSQDSQ